MPRRDVISRQRTGRVQCLSSSCDKSRPKSKGRRVRQGVRKLPPLGLNLAVGGVDGGNDSGGNLRPQWGRRLAAAIGGTLNKFVGFLPRGVGGRGQQPQRWLIDVRRREALQQEPEQPPHLLASGFVKSFELPFLTYPFII